MHIFFPTCVLVVLSVCVSAHVSLLCVSMEILWRHAPETSICQIKDLT